MGNRRIAASGLRDSQLRRARSEASETYEQHVQSIVDLVSMLREGVYRGTEFPRWNRRHELRGHDKLLPLDGEQWVQSVCGCGRMVYG